MKKKIQYAVFCLCCTLLLGGCIQAPQQTPEEISQIAEAIAGMILSYDKHYDDDLIDQEEQKENAEKDSQSKGEGGKEEFEDVSGGKTPSAGSEKSQQEVTLNEVFNNKNFNISFTGVEKYSTYPEKPEENGFSFTPSEGNIFLVMKFKIKNTTDKSKTFNQLDSGINYRLDLGKKMVKPDIALQLNDLQFINMEITGSSSQEAVVIFQVAKDIEIDKAHLLVYTDEKTAILNIK